jgi:hypothetical protein
VPTLAHVDEHDQVVWDEEKQALYANTQVKYTLTESDAGVMRLRWDRLTGMSKEGVHRYLRTRWERRHAAVWAKAVRPLVDAVTARVAHPWVGRFVRLLDIASRPAPYVGRIDHFDPQSSRFCIMYVQ